MDIKNRIKLMSEIIEAKPSYLPSIEITRYDGHPFIREIQGFYHYIILERNEEIKRLIFHDTDELLYEIFKDVSFKMGLDFELDNRIDNQDSRRLIFEKQEELLFKLNKNWGNRIKDKHKEILSSFPYKDS